MSDRRLGNILVDEGLLTPAQLEEALEHAAQYSLRLGQALVLEGECTEQQIADALARKFHLERMDLGGFEVSPALLNRVRPKNVQRLRIIPISVEQESGREILTVATAHPENLLQVDELRAGLGMGITVKVATESDVSRIITELFGNDTVQSSADMGLLDVCFNQFGRGRDECLLIQEKSIPTAINLGANRPTTGNIAFGDLLRNAQARGAARVLEQYREATHEEMEDFLVRILEPEALARCRQVQGTTCMHRHPELGRFKITVEYYRPVGQEKRQSDGVYSICIDRVAGTRFG